MPQRTWFITGISSGFGRRMAEMLLADGNRVVGTVRDLDSVRELRKAHGDRLSVHRLDLTDGAGAITAVVDAAFGAAGRIDVVVNNAGYGLFGAVEELTDEQIVHQIDTNLLGSIRVVRAAVPHLRAQGGGRILQLSTYGGQATNPGASVYSAGKWGIEGFMEATALDLAPFGIGVTIIEPGSAGTGFRTGGARVAEPLAAYDGTPAAMVRRIKDPSLPSVGDVDKMVAAMIATVDRPEAPRRLALGSDSYRFMNQALTARLAELENGKATALSTDRQAA
ncbi:SDR family oxidoreductase [Streptomyces fumanus]|uniref:Short-chain dehydrogenase/reductase n=1 Tax=Streptomyces fumanus TaxID=67302 RepID=A0A919A2V3_9ACTN|nr:SDR family oxidoreductase [Streptomyces fumanus]GHE82371.1 short-chain dehydrogenase/reductase [Streptomyces fumanus]